jgi:hypothetical protein
MDQCLIHSDTHDAENSYHGWKGKVVSGQCKNNDSSSDRQEHTGDDDDGIFDIVELDNQHENHQDKSDHHGFT